MSRIVRSVMALAVVLVLGLPAAAQAPAVTAGVGAPFSLRLGAQAIIEGSGVLVRFDRVLDDSRCPVDVMCVWAGVFRMALVVETAGEPTATEVVLDTMGGEGTVAGLRFTLLSVKPVRRSMNEPDGPLPYAVLLRADRVQ